MKLFLCGGGSGEKTTKAMEEFSKYIDKNKPLLYVPLAMQSFRYSDCYEWIKREVSSIEITNIDMVCSSEELSLKNLDDYCAIFIGGGNTYQLLRVLKRTNAFNKIREFIQGNGIVFGSSAGAIIFGKDIDSCKYEDNNEINLEDTSGFNVLNGFSLLCHYCKNVNQTEINEKYLREYSKKCKTIYLPEEDTIFINNDKISFIGNENYCIFDNYVKRMVDPLSIDIEDILK